MLNKRSTTMTLITGLTLLSFGSIFIVVNGLQLKNPVIKKCMYGNTHTTTSMMRKNTKQSSISSSLLSLKGQHSSSRLFLAPPTSSLSSSTIAKVEKTEEEWNSILTPEEFDVLRMQGTEPPWTSPWNDISKDDQNGTFTCAGCGTPLFRTSSKFDSGTGWPSFVQPLDNTVLDVQTDFKLILPRTECACATCGGHLGHVFPDGPEPTGQRYCINGVALQYIADDDEKADPTMVADVITREALTAATPFKPQPLTILPTALLYVGLAISYVNGFYVRYQQQLGGGGDVQQQMSAFDYFPLAIASVCVYFAARDVRRLF